MGKWKQENSYGRQEFSCFFYPLNQKNPDAVLPGKAFHGIIKIDSGALSSVYVNSAQEAGD